MRIFLVGPKAIETAFRDAGKGRADAVLVLPNVVVVSQRKEIAALTGIGVGTKEIHLYRSNRWLLLAEIAFVVFWTWILLLTLTHARFPF